MQVSLSAFQAWQRCEQLYYYSYVARLRPLVEQVAPTRGNLLHSYLESYYRGLKGGLSAEAAHEAGLAEVMSKQKEVKVAAMAAFMLGDQPLAAQFHGLIPAVVDMASRYFDVRGRTDAERYEVLYVEEWITLDLVAGISSVSKIDLILRDRGSWGRTWLTEHKSTGSVPSSSVRLRDLQTLLYNKVAEIALGIKVDGILWNYIRTKEPQTPHRNKNGRFSEAVSIDTTWDLFARTVRADGQDPDDYPTTKARLASADTEIWFPRYEHTIVTEPQMLLEDYATEARRIRQATMMWEWGVEKPVRSLTRDCDFCSYYKLCEAAITGGDERDVIRMRFRQSKQKQEETVARGS